MSEPLEEAIYILDSIRHTLTSTVEEARHAWFRAGSQVFQNPKEALRFADVNKIDDLRKDVLIASAKLSGFELAIRALKDVAHNR